MENKPQTTFGDKEQMTDLLSGEKYLAATYCSFLSESATPEVIGSLSALLSDTHRAQQQVFFEMNSRGWYPVTKAEDAKVQQAKDKFAATVCQ